MSNGVINDEDSNYETYCTMDGEASTVSQLRAFGLYGCFVFFVVSIRSSTVL